MLFRSPASAAACVRGGSSSPAKPKTRPVHDLPLFADFETEAEAAPQTDVGRSLGDDDDTIVQFPGGVRI